MKVAVFILLSLFLFAEDVGWIENNCLGIKNSHLKKGDKLLILSVDNKKSTATVIKETFDAKGCDPLFKDRREINRHGGRHFYLLKLSEPIQGGLAFLPGFWKESFSLFTCTSSEGVVYSLKEDGKEIWQGYYYLAYDIEETCP